MLLLHLYAITAARKITHKSKHMKQKSRKKTASSSDLQWNKKTAERVRDFIISSGVREMEQIRFQGVGSLGPFMLSPACSL